MRAENSDVPDDYAVHAIPHWQKEQRMSQLEKQTAIITGGGTGIGFAVARRFHAEGASVVLCGRREEVIKEAAKDISPQGERVMAVRADVTCEEEVQSLVQKTMDWTGRIDILINNAASNRINKPPEETTLEEFRSVIDTNVVGVFLCSREVGRVMIKQGHGRIVNLSSMSGSIVNKFFHGGSYEISKAAVNMLTKTFATEWAPHNIRVNAVAPGYYDTEPNRKFFIQNQELYQKIIDLIPVRSLGNMDELCKLILYLASPGVDYLTGTTVTIDGGYTAW
jgi:gluconate 5-dehydrogenase